MVPIWIAGSGHGADKKQVKRRIREHNGISIVYNPSAQVGLMEVCHRCSEYTISVRKIFHNGMCATAELQSTPRPH